jgi:ketosteroid isomerase-like protein
MSKSNDISVEDRVAIEAVILEHNWRSDHGLQEKAADLYEEDAIITGVINVSGREALRAIARQDPPDLKQRHATTNLRLMPLADGTVQATTYTAVYRHRGDGSSDTTPGVIVDSTFMFRRSADGQWRIMRRDDSIVFRAVGPGGPGSPTAPSAKVPEPSHN